MLAEMLKAVLIISLIGSLLAVVLTLLKPLTKKVFGYNWHYYIWLAVLLTMILPVKISIPENEVVHIPSAVEENVSIVETDVPQTEFVQNTVTAQIPEIKINTDFIDFDILGLIWIIGIVLMLVISITGYLTFVINIHKNSVLTECKRISDYTKRNVKVRVCNKLSSPFIMGIFKSTLVLPNVELTEEQLDNILHHEMTHLKRNDILCKWFAVLVRSIHWFNPVAYYIVNQINTECEISCDMQAVKNMDRESEESYIDTIIYLLDKNNVKSIPLTTGMTGSKRALKRRFTMIKNKRNIRKIVSVISVFVSVIILISSVFAGGILANRELTDYSIRIYNDEKLMKFENKPFFSDYRVYIPLREMADKLGIKNQIIWNNGKITIHIDGHLDYYEIEIGSNQINYIPVSEGNRGERLEAGTPVLVDGVTYVPFEYMEYTFHRFENQGLNVWFKFGDITSNVPYLDNMEGMTYSDILSLQYRVDNGHFPWRLDPMHTIKSMAEGFGLGEGEITAFAGDGVKCSATYTTQNNEYIIELFKPIQKDEQGVWILRTIYDNNDLGLEFSYDVHFSDIGGTEINKEANWYYVESDTLAHIYMVNRTPLTITAYYTDSGTEMEQYKKVVGRAKFPYDQAPATVHLNFNDDIHGHLWFVLDFGNHKIITETYNVHR